MRLTKSLLEMRNMGILFAASDISGERECIWNVDHAAAHDTNNTVQKNYDTI